MPNQIIYKAIGKISKIWIFLGRPFPSALRFIRHKCLGHFWPTIKYNSDEKETCDVAVIITSHNYGHYLSQAIESVLSQSIKPKEIIVVDDSSTDNTKEVAEKYSKNNVKYIYGEWKNVGCARNAGVNNSQAPFIVCLDADDMLHPELIRCSLKTLKENPDTAIAYTDHSCFGADSSIYKAPDPFDWKRFETENHFNCSDMVRREALLQAGGWSESNLHHIDWVTWRRILELGWKAKKSNGMFFYRKHKENMFSAFKKEASYAQRIGFLETPAMLFIALSGREWAWPKTAEFLQQQTFPHKKIHLVIMDTSQNKVFSEKVKKWLSECDYQSHTYIKETVGTPGLADKYRGEHSDEASLACTKIYNRFARMCTTPLAFFLEDDVVPLIDAYERLIRHFDIKVISVSGFYMHRTRNSPVAWEWNKYDLPQDVSPGRGVSSVGGNGFGCLAIRGEFLRRSVFHSGPPCRNYDQNFYYSYVLKDKFKALMDWNVRCDHLNSPNYHVPAQFQTTYSAAG
ncbi:glycosyltransferase family 2 protein [Patescibacteria group bacterium]|nr:glycosyltransferase family 2 protein [Patescibacteria group bacterium]MBU1123414.1 glycosyltransferase family 2 protein [Patescibacteria group bacterium]MBU1911379.1 glycosyltransferase family 2 protein [Patescibacteria group bacterium]